jgi:hypothetical protein
VRACSDTEVQPKPAWTKRKKDYIAHVVSAPEPVRLVSAADKLANARSILSDLRAMGDKLWERFNGGRDGTLWYYRSLVNAFEIAGYRSSPECQDRCTVIVAELDRVVTEIEALAAAE